MPSGNVRLTWAQWREWSEQLVPMIDAEIKRAASRVQSRTRSQIPRLTGQSKRWFRAFPRAIRRGQGGMVLRWRGELPQYWGRMIQRHPQLRGVRAAAQAEIRNRVLAVLRRSSIDVGEGE